MKHQINIDDKVSRVMKTELQKRKVSVEEYVELLIKRDLKLK
jgi:hypothetical protein